MLNAAPDRSSFLIENSIPVHEKRHFFDAVSTPFGIFCFLRGFFLTVQFHNLLNELHGRRLRIPFKRWISHRDCPAAVKQFVRIYDNYESWLGSFSAGSKWVQPASASPYSGVNQSLVLEMDGRKFPCAAYKIGDKLRIFEVTPLSIFEGLAVAVQLQSIMQFDATAAKDWLLEVDLHPVYWYYTSALNLAAACCDGDIDRTLKMMEFALMIPLGGEKADCASDEKEPGWRFTAMAEYLLQHNSSEDINVVADIVCDQKGWKQSRENLASAKSHLDTVHVFKEGWNYVQAVVDDFRRISHKTLDARKQSPLLGMSYLTPMLDLKAPIHRKIRPDGTAEIFCDPEHGDAWAHFMILSAMTGNAVNGSSLVCAFSKSGLNQYPANRSCDCDARTQREACLLAQIVETYAIEVTSI